MKTINIKGKDYVMVNERIKEFREKYAGWSLISEIINLTEDTCVIKATVLDPNGQVLATGHAQEDRSSSMINKTSFVENCETSAWGRALGNLGIGIDESVASAEEVDMAIKKQEKIEYELIVGGKYIFASGKHKGKSIEQVAQEDSEYLDWLLDSDKVGKAIKDNIVKFRSEG